ncbi:MAG: alpha-L-arabinofuranosidase C-terminal domain-containing protein [FCB group bacterium]|jgi:alpha-N-arabinofuranosidase|nr:alpha-L-arabinofuranosidase C-terminal domain-containing protein [FCB group bacterium]
MLSSGHYWYGEQVFGELGTRYFLRDALGIAAGLHEFFRNTDVFQMANYAQTVNVIGAIKTTKTAAAFETTGLALKLYRQRFGTIPVVVSGDTGPLDVVAAWTEDRKAITVGVVNPTREAQELPFNLQGAKLTGKGRVWSISGPDEMAYNHPGEAPKVTVVEQEISGVERSIKAQPVSVMLFRLEVE